MDRLRQIKTCLAAIFADLERRSFTFALFVAAARSFNRDHCMHMAAGIAYYAFFSLFPLLLGLIALASFLFQSAEVQDQIIRAAAQSLPGSEAFVRRNIEQVLMARGTIGIVAVVGLLWAAKAVFGAITTSLNLAWDVTETRSLWELTAMEVALVFGTGFFFAASLILTYVLELLSRLALPFLSLPLADLPFWTLIAAPFGIALNAVGFLLLYRFLPNTPLSFGDVWPGALVAAVLFEMAKRGYVVYTTRFTNYDLVYGPLAAAIALLFWAWLSGVILLFGAEVSARYTESRRGEGGEL